MFNQSLAELQRNSAFRKLDAQTSDSSSLDLFNIGYANQMMLVINAQNALIVKLLQKQNELYQELSKRSSSSNSSSGSQNKPAEGRKVSGYQEINQQEQISSGSPAQREHYEVKNNVKIIQKENSIICHNKVLKNNNFEDESNSSGFDGQSNSNMRDIKPSFKKKQTQTKNMVKNFAKAIFSYIRKNKEKRAKVLGFLGISDQEFMKIFDSLRGHIHSISQLRNLWIPEGNIYHKAFRIMSCEYLRKSCLQRTFNSRVENFQIHLKYRQRLIQNLKCPEQFTILKTS